MKPRIAYILQSFFVGGYETALYNISKRLKDYFDFYFIATENKDIHPHFYEVGKPIYLGSDWNAVTKYLVDNKISIVQYGNKIEYKQCAIRARVPIIIERTAGPRSCDLDRTGVTHVISSTVGTVPLIRKNYTGEISVIYNGIDVNEFDTMAPNYLFDKNDFVISYAARMGRGQAFDILIKAVIEANRLANVKLILIGDRPNIKGYEDIRDELRKISKPLGDRCIFTGYLLDPLPTMAASSMYVCPARHHGISNSIIEASALGLPIIATNVGQTNEIVHDGKNGILVKPNSIGEVRDAILKLKDSPQKRKEFGAYGKKLVSKEFNIDLQAQKYLEVYNRLLLY